MARIATQVLLGTKLKDIDTHRRKYSHFGVKEAVFPFSMFPEVDPVLGPEMRSTGEVLGLADSFAMAFYKSQVAAGFAPPVNGTALITIAKVDRQHALQVAKDLADSGFRIVATEGTADFLIENGIVCDTVHKLNEGRPDIVDMMKNGDIQFVLNTPVGKQGTYDDSYIRKSAIKFKIPYFTTTDAGRAAARGIRAARENRIEVKSLQEYHAMIE
jgi:carbamoyl-phosphate synthase large subunit